MEECREETCEVVKAVSGRASEEGGHVEKLAPRADVEEVLDMALAMWMSGRAQLT